MPGVPGSVRVLSLLHYLSMLRIDGVNALELFFLDIFTINEVSFETFKRLKAIPRKPDNIILYFPAHPANKTLGLEHVGRII